MAANAFARCHCSCRHTRSDIRADMKCGHPTSATMRERPLYCDGCSCPIRMTRSWLAQNGEPSCGCGGTFRCECIDDRCCLPGEAGELAMQEWNTLDAAFAVASENARKAGATRSRRARVRKMSREDRAVLASRDASRSIDDDMPF